MGTTGLELWMVLQSSDHLDKIKRRTGANKDRFSRPPRTHCRAQQGCEYPELSYPPGQSRPGHF